MKLLLLAALAGCGSATVNLGPLPARTGTVVVEGCTLDDTQSAALASSSMPRVVSTVLMLCLDAGPSALTPPDAATQLAPVLSSLRALGYRVDLGFSITDDSGAALSRDQASSLVESESWRAQTIAAIAALPIDPDGIELAAPQLDGTQDSSDGVTALVAELSASVHPARALDILVPPTTGMAIDLPSDYSYSTAALAPLVDRLRVMTLDFSCCGAPPGPTIDAGWAVTAARLALALAGPTAIDVAVPLYGWDFSAAGPVSLGYDEAQTLAALTHAQVTRDSAGALTFSYNGDHVVWFDDAVSTLRTLRAWQPSALPAAVGVVYYGLGAEDPALWDALAEALP